MISPLIKILKAFYAFICMCLALSCNNLKSHSSCSDFKNGRFLFRFTEEPKNLSFLIERKDSIQIEKGSNGWVTKLLVKWTGECSYETKLIESTGTFPDSIQQMRKKFPLNVEILKCTNTYYTFKAKRDNSDYVLLDTMWVQK